MWHNKVFNQGKMSSIHKLQYNVYMISAASSFLEFYINRTYNIYRLFPACVTSLLCVYCRVILPHYIFQISIIGTPSGIIVNTKLGIRLFWNLDDSLDVRSTSSHSQNIKTHSQNYPELHSFYLPILWVYKRVCRSHLSSRCSNCWYLFSKVYWICPNQCLYFCGQVSQ